ncbi:hypothetical protein SRABI98_03553 [Microbacterium sp. Bi98]|uniref:sialate O-acetylesterase n=1 Tax=Microbacterium sp. Bi98 TaxID=2821116 RepID=UPI001D90C6D9|nr:sialate O-acetylesterase [Microbacterium sp. Bi98]CAH0262863.1 hypothetical protein SRABI98_03553 [Microbacterium sp. Bi98]
MGYYNPDGFWMHEEADAADPGAGVSELLNKLTLSLPAGIRKRVIAELAAAPTVEEAAVTAVEAIVALLDIVQFGDPGIPEEGQFPDDPRYLIAETDSIGRVSRAMKADTGGQYMPLATIDTLGIGDDDDTITRRAAGSGIGFSYWDGERMSHNTVDEKGHFIPETLEFIANYVRGGTGGGMDIGVVCGQSNGMIASYLELANFRGQDSLLWAWENGQIVPLGESQVNLGSEFIRAYAKHASQTGRRVLIVQAAVGSLGFGTTSINPPPEGYRYHFNGTWDRTLTADTRNRFAMAVSMTLAALAAAGPGSRLIAMLWSQGEADGGMTQEQYAAKLDDLIAAFRAAVGYPALPVIVGSMTPEMHTDHEGFEQIARALADTPRRLERVGFVWGPANGHRYSQTVHYSYAGQIDRAGRMAREGLMEALANLSTNEPVSPLNSRVTRNGSTATVEWDRPLCHVDELRVEYSTDYHDLEPDEKDNATWALASIDTMHGSRAAATVPASTAVAFRITVENSVGATMPALVNG